MAFRNHKIAPELQSTVEEGFTQREERESGEGCSRESISDDQAQLLASVDHGSRRMKSLQPSLTLAADFSTTETVATSRLESRMGKRFVRYRNSWVGDGTITLNLKLLRSSHAASQIEEIDEGMQLCLKHSCC